MANLYRNTSKIIYGNRTLALTYILTIILSIFTTGFAIIYFSNFIGLEMLDTNKYGFSDIIFIEFKDKYNSNMIITLNKTDIDQYRNYFQKLNITPIRVEDNSIFTESYNKIRTKLFVIDDQFREVFTDIPLETGDFLEVDYSTVNKEAVLSSSLYKKIRDRSESTNKILINGSEIKVKGIIKDGLFNYFTGIYPGDFVIITDQAYKDIFSKNPDQVSYNYLTARPSANTVNLTSVSKELYKFLDDEIAGGQLTTIHQSQTIQDRILINNKSLLISKYVLLFIGLLGIIIAMFNLFSIVRVNQILNQKTNSIKKVYGADIFALLKESLFEYISLSIIGSLLGYLLSLIFNWLIFSLVLNIKIDTNISYFLIIIFSTLITGIFIGLINALTIYKQNIQYVLNREY